MNRYRLMSFGQCVGYAVTRGGPAVVLFDHTAQMYADLDAAQADHLGVVFEAFGMLDADARESDAIAQQLAEWDRAIQMIIWGAPTVPGMRRP